jgi:site-specific DNA recombinase
VLDYCARTVSTTRVENAETPRRWGIYNRISDARDGANEVTEAGVKRQEKNLLRLAESVGGTVIDSYVDNDVSAWGGRKNRAEYQRMLSDLRSGRINGVLASAPDRLHRSSEEHNAFLRLAGEIDVRVLTLTGGSLDHHTAGGRLQSKIAADVGEYESDVKSERVLAAMAELRANGATQGGVRPFGLTQGRRDLHEIEAPLVRAAAAAVVAGEPLKAVCRAWSAAGVTTVRGKPWNATGLKHLLLSAWARGVTPDGNPAQWPTLIDATTGAQLDAILRDPARASRRPEVKRHLLSGLLVCGLCGSRMGSALNNKARGYRCMACFGSSLKAETVEEDITYRLLARLESARVAEGMLVAAAPTADEAALAKAKNEQVVLDEMLGAGDLDRESYTRARRKLTARRDAIMANVRHDIEADRRRRVQAEAFDLAQRWEDLTVDRRRLVFDAFIDNIVVSPASVPGSHSYEPRRLVVTWRE